MTSSPTIRFLRLHPSRDADIPLPTYMTPQSSGMDIFAAMITPMNLQPGDIATIPTGFAMAIPRGFEAQIRPRSGLAASYGVSVLNTPGTIDADYRGEVKVVLINHGRDTYTIKRGDRISQMVIQPICRAELAQVDSLDETARSTGGFGHTGR